MDSTTPVITAIRNSQPGMLKNLLTGGADPDEMDRNGDIPLIVAVRYNSEIAIRHLFTHGADVNKKDRVGNTALLIAVRARRPDMVKLLLDHGADMDVKDSFGRTPWAYAHEVNANKEMAALMEQAKKDRNPAPRRQEKLRENARRHTFRPPPP